MKQEIRESFVDLPMKLVPVDGSNLDRLSWFEKGAIWIVEDTVHFITNATWKNIGNTWLKLYLASKYRQFFDRIIQIQDILKLIEYDYDRFCFGLIRRYQVQQPAKESGFNSIEESNDKVGKFVIGSIDATGFRWGNFLKIFCLKLALFSGDMNAVMILFIKLSEDFTSSKST